MRNKNPSLFMGAKIRETTDERLVLKLPRLPTPTWTLLVGLAIVWAAPAALLTFKAMNAPEDWTAGAIAAGGTLGFFSWGWTENIALRWSKLAPLRGRVELRRLAGGQFSLSINGRPEQVSRRRGLFFLEYNRTTMLVLVVGRRVGSVSYFVKISGGGTDLRRTGQWDTARAELARGSQELEDRWAADSVVPLVHAILRLFDLGPQPETGGYDGLSCFSELVWLIKIFALAGFHAAALLWLDRHGNPLPSFNPMTAGLIFGAGLVVPYGLAFAHHVRRFFIGPLNRAAEEMMSLCQED